MTCSMLGSLRLCISTGVLASIYFAVASSPHRKLAECHTLRLSTVNYGNANERNSQMKKYLRLLRNQVIYAQSMCLRCRAVTSTSVVPRSDDTV